MSMYLRWPHVYTEVNPLLFWKERHPNTTKLFYLHALQIFTSLEAQPGIMQLEFDRANLGEYTLSQCTFPRLFQISLFATSVESEIYTEIYISNCLLNVFSIE